MHPIQKLIGNVVPGSCVPPRKSTKGTMLVMPSNNTGFDAGVLFGRYPGRLGHLHSVESREPKDCALLSRSITRSILHRPMKSFPWALDNGVFGAWSSGKPWSEEPFYQYLECYADLEPLWAVVPDWVGDRDQTLRLWDKHAPAVAAFGCPLAMAVQDGMVPEDVPQEASVVFIGGTTPWKWATLDMWTAAFPRVHVGRVNSRRLLELCENAGAESCDGTGWFRSPKRTYELEKYLADLPHKTP